MTEPLEEQLTRHEGLKLKPYVCPAGALTIGVGHNLDANGISKAVAMAILKEDIARARDDVASLLDFFKVEKWHLSPARQDALANMAFNLGRRRLAGFEKMFAAIKADRFDLAAAEILDSQYAKEVGKRAIELAEQMLRGSYP